MKRTVFPATLLACVALTSGIALAADRYDAEGHYYEYVSSSVDWSSAKTAAANRTFSGMKGRLVCINSSGENDFLFAFLAGRSGSVWMGAFQEEDAVEPAGDWEWISGEKWSYTNWNGGEPNGKLEDVAEFQGNTGRWNDVRASSSRAYVVEYVPVAEMSINGGAFGTSDISVTIDLTFESGDDAGDPDVRIRNVGEAWSAWEEWGDRKEWTLPTGDGEKAVEVELRDAHGLIYPLAGEIYLDTVPPTGTVVIGDGTGWVRDPRVDVHLTWTDLQSGVDGMRLRNAGGAWSPWTAAAGTTSWDLAEGSGLKTVEVQFRDGAGNVSATCRDSVGLDQDAPEASVTMGDGSGFFAGRSVVLHVEATDTGGSGLHRMRFRRDLTGDGWGDWTAFAPTHVWTVTYGDGTKGVEVQVSDRAGNLSAVESATGALDGSPPECTSFRVNRDSPYVLPGEEIEFEVYGTDGLGGSGVEGFKASFDGGRGWSDWYSLFGGYRATVARPAVEGLCAATVVLRDAVGNESGPVERRCYLVEKDLACATGGGKLTGDLSPVGDVDAFRVDLVKGDALTVKLKGKAAVKGRSLLLRIDIVGPAGDRIHDGRYPADAKKVGIAGFVAPETGRYTFLVHRDPASEAEGGALSLSLKVKQAKENRKAKGVSAGPDLIFGAAEGSLLKATLAADGLTAAQLTLTGPEGPVAFTAKEKAGKVSFSATLDAGCGDYAIHAPGVSGFSYTLSVKLPRKVKGVLGE